MSLGKDITDKIGKLAKRTATGAITAAIIATSPGCEKDNPEYELNDSHETNVWTEQKVFEKLDDKVFTRVMQKNSAEKMENQMIYFDADSKTATIAESYKDPTDPYFKKFQNKETFDANYDAYNVKLELEGGPTINLSPEISCGTYRPKEKIKSITMNHKCHTLSNRPVDLPNIEGKGTYKIHYKGLTQEKNAKVSFHDDHIEVKNQDLLPNKIPYNNNGNESPYVKIDGTKNYISAWSNEDNWPGKNSQKEGLSHPELLDLNVPQKHNEKTGKVTNKDTYQFIRKN